MGEGEGKKTGLDLKLGNKTQEAHWSEKRVTLAETDLMRCRFEDHRALGDFLSFT